MSRRNLATLDTDIFQGTQRILQQAMAHGITNDMIYGGLETGQTALQALNVSQATQNCSVPTRRVTWQGEVYKYAKAVTTVAALPFGLKFGALLSDGVGYTAPLQTQDAGDSTIRIDAGGAAAVAADELKGGYIIIHTHGLYDDMTRRITANTLADGDGYTTITVDAPWTIGILTSHGVETMPNPYVWLQSNCPSGAGGPGGSRLTSVAGMPMALAASANYYQWIKTWGPHFVNPQGSVGYTVTNDRRTVFFDHEGSIICVNTAAVTTSLQQVAGFIINEEDASTGPPLVMLTISP